MAKKRRRRYEHEPLGVLGKIGRFDLIISDIKMPNLDGVELYQRILREYSEMAHRILYMTGDSVSPEIQSFLGEYGLPFLVKPFGLGELLQAIGDRLR